MIASRLPQITGDELREEREIESGEYQQTRELGPAFGIHPAGYFRPPEVHAAEIGQHHASYHDVVEVGHDEVSIRHVHVDSQGSKEQAGQAPDGEQPDEAESIEHGRVVADGAAEHGGGPVEDLDG